MSTRMFTISVIRKDGALMKAQSNLSLIAVTNMLPELRKLYDSTYKISVHDDHGRVLITFGNKPTIKGEPDNGTT